ncbi:MAG: SUMF1/EgtB/PvdO family nonheme iron enzyme [Spirochaetaceae bacterium]|nr:SUMF1/EgtB/PvdO family nonheme iron enzyme [Spirochaetaceae bacterium]
MFKRKAKIDTSHIKVKLKPKFGLQPQEYVLYIFYVVAGLLAFALLLLPGLINYGSRVTITSIPAGASVYAGDRLLGATPVTAFVPAGDYNLVIVKDGFNTIEQPLQVRGRAFATLILPRRINQNYQLAITNVNDLLATSFAEASLWVLTPNWADFPRRPVLLETVRDLVEVWPTLTPFEQHLVEHWALDMWALIESEASLNEVRMVRNMLTNLLPNLGDGARDSFNDILRILARENLADGNIQLNSGSLSPITVNGFNFNHSAGGSYVMGNSVAFGRGLNEYYPHLVNLPGFYFMANLITEWQFVNFLQATNTTDNAPYNRSAVADNSAAYLTYEQAMAFAGWLNASLPADLNGYEVRLINEAEWEFLARQGRLNITAYEWTNDSYFIYRYLIFAGEANLPIYFKGQEIVVRGYHPAINEVMPINMRGSQNAALASPYLGFRLVIAPASGYRH